MTTFGEKEEKRTRSEGVGSGPGDGGNGTLKDGDQGSDTSGRFPRTKSKILWF